ncbi:MAG: methylenetetrahydrofolate reductase [NAD(P)H] [Moraxellaceae bacterium]|nr:methylenetetrahydrofolate reductase [NAD(P)H] [Moraxellaceae bacterium]MBP8852312.1 methylenetetrahydrofolate reductase [NAD(P)H] [Moraxellaceae bacterium]MBP9045244.1 methylenetetrahydrofolate reductase [NAD(P)H] [Moraxellaceae bacterium]MBP9730683.1 methylenetetrahydrofolate reductase [NAD(P)H] [Moraxellaceae bacterium]
MKKHFSFEFFPPKTDAGAVKLREVTKTLATLQPEYFSVTYGAGGSTRDRSLGTVLEIQHESGRPAAPHLSCIGDSREELSELLSTYIANGVRHIVALRGDLPSGMGGAHGELAYAADLVKFIRETTGDHFHIEVAAYPECHPQAANLDTDIRHFVNKVHQGASSAITQYFFNADSYFHFIERVQKQGVSIPIIPGIMPITNFANLVRFSDACGAEIPRWIRKQMASYGDDPISIQNFGEDVITGMCEQLLAGGAPGLHFYTMNQTEPTMALWRRLGLPGT